MKILENLKNGNTVGRILVATSEDKTIFYVIPNIFTPTLGSNFVNVPNGSIQISSIMVPNKQEKTISRKTFIKEIISEKYLSKDIVIEVENINKEDSAYKELVKLVEEANLKESGIILPGNKEIIS